MQDVQGNSLKPSSLGHLSSGRWQFDESVTRVFDDMLERSIPQYEVMRRSVFDIACRFVQADTYVVDLGCSKGDALAPFLSKFGGRNRYLGVDVAPPMLAAARERFRQSIAEGVVEIRDLDLRTAYPDVEASVTLCVLCLQFTPIDHRQRILHDAYTHLKPGGALILVEKVLGASATLTSVMADLHHASKRERGYSSEEIERKRLSLEGVLVPVTAQWNEGLLRATGFAQVDCFWRWMNFSGWIALKNA